MKAFFTLFILSFLILNIASAQDSPNWPPDESLIFSQNIEIQEVVSPETGGWPTEILNRVKVDNEARLIGLYEEESDSWREFPFPDEIQQAYSPQHWHNSIYFSVPDEEIAYTWLVWELDLQTEHFEIFSPCPNTQVRNNIVNDEQWIMATDIQTNEVFLCDYQAGELYSPLPLDATDWSALMVSPDRAYLLLEGLDAEFADRGGPYRLYSYEVATGNFLPLGGLSSQTLYGYYVGWLNETQMLYRADDVHSSEYFLIDVSHENSVESVMRGFVRDRDEPHRLEELQLHSVLTRHADLFEHIPCVLRVFDFALAEAYEYPLGYNCGGVYSPNENSYFYLAYDQDPASTSSLNILDFPSGNVTEILEGEIEMLESVSPDGAYAAIITDNNGIVDRAGYEDTQFFHWKDGNNPSLSFVDVSAQEIVYEIPYGAWRSDAGSYYDELVYDTHAYGWLKTAAAWIDNDTALVLGASETNQMGEHRLLDFGGAEIEVTELNAYVELILPDSRSLILSEIEEDSRVLYSLYKIESRVKQPLFYNPSPEDYRFVVSLGEANTLSLHITLSDYSIENAWINYSLSFPPEILSKQ